MIDETLRKCMSCWVQPAVGYTPKGIWRCERCAEHLVQKGMPFTFAAQGKAVNRAHKPSQARQGRRNLP
jgi:ribosomal protein L37AE/L43A